MGEIVAFAFDFGADKSATPDNKFDYMLGYPMSGDVTQFGLYRVKADASTSSSALADAFMNIATDVALQAARNGGWATDLNAAASSTCPDLTFKVINFNKVRDDDDDDG